MALGPLPASTSPNGTFVQWTRYGSPISENTTMTGTMEYVSHWIADVSWDANHGVGGVTWRDEPLVARQQIGRLPPNPTWGTTNRFAGWWTTPAASGGTEITAQGVITLAQTRFYARWVPIRTLTFNAGTGATWTANPPAGWTRTSSTQLT
ncbi:MAG: hypothetical protein FWE08_08295, partial [Oscillospiraceae bacterium]|nr:hypothetical protein [Oscillospiraceae bacterium]